jgi:tRNA(Ile)-lysidine synthase
MAATGLLDELLARCRFPVPGTAVTCAVSGGPDSLALLALATAARCDVTAVHVDHGLRPGSGDEAEVVRAAAARFGAAIRAERVELEPGPNLEARARAARYSALPADVMTGHTLDDQAETVLLNMLRGAGPDGLAAMRDDGRRPLLGLRRAETRELCASLDLQPIHDCSNDDPAFRRNRVRNELLPLLDDIAGRDVAPVLTRQAAVFASVSDLLIELAASLDVADAAALTGASPVLARTAVRMWLREFGDGHPPDAAAVDRVLSVARGDVRATEIEGGWRIARTAGRLRVEPPTESDR